MAGNEKRKRRMESTSAALENSRQSELMRDTDDEILGTEGAEFGAAAPAPLPACPLAVEGVAGVDDRAIAKRVNGLDAWSESAKLGETLIPRAGFRQRIADTGT